MCLCLCVVVVHYFARTKTDIQSTQLCFFRYFNLLVVRKTQPNSLSVSKIDDDDKKEAKSKKSHANSVQNVSERRRSEMASMGICQKWIFFVIKKAQMWLTYAFTQQQNKSSSSPSSWIGDWIGVSVCVCERATVLSDGWFVRCVCALNKLKDKH